MRLHSWLAALVEAGATHDATLAVASCGFRGASADGGTDPFSVPWNQFTEFCQVCLLQDNSTMKLKDIDTLFIATNVPSERARVVQTQARKSGNVLVRFEFLESIVRLAKKKFFNTGAASSYAEAAEMLLKNHILPLGPHEDVIEFRETQLCVGALASGLNAQ